jgi:hypothetical protein
MMAGHGADEDEAELLLQALGDEQLGGGQRKEIIAEIIVYAGTIADLSSKISIASMCSRMASTSVRSIGRVMRAPASKEPR